MWNIYKTEFRVEKVIKKKGSTLSVKTTGYDISFNSWIYKKRPYTKWVIFENLVVIVKTK